MKRLLFFCLVSLSLNVSSQEWPARPVKFIVSQAPGTSPDITARLIADRLARPFTGIADSSLSTVFT